MSVPDTSANLQKKRGPKPDPVRAVMRRTFSEWSDRQFATFWRAHRMLAEFTDESTYKAAIEIASRPNGSLNVSKFAREADRQIFLLLMAGRSS